MVAYSFQAGLLRRRITLESPVQTRDETGGMVNGWAVFAENVPAAIESLNGRELYLAQQYASDVTVKITIRYRPGVTQTMRALHSLDFGCSPQTVEVYNIEAVLPDPTGRKFIDLLCRLRQADGLRADG